MLCGSLCLRHVSSFSYPVLTRGLLPKGMAYSTSANKTIAGHGVTTKGKGIEPKKLKTDSSTAPKPFMPTCKPPKEMIASMVRAGAVKEEVKGENLRILRIAGVDSEAWQIYKDWACSLGEVDPLVAATFAPPAAVIGSSRCTPTALVGAVLHETLSIINLMAPLGMHDIPTGGVPVLSGPLLAPVISSNVHHATVAVSVLPQVLSNPGVNFPAIHRRPAGQYVCQVWYTWRGALFEVPIFRA